MSGSYGQQNRTTESYNSDPNSFSNASGPDAGFQNQPGGGGFQSEQFGQGQRTTHDPTDTSTFNNEPTGARRSDFGDSQSGGQGQGQFRSGGDPNEKFGTSGFGRGGNTTDSNTVGTGGNFDGLSSTGRGGAGVGSGGVDGDNWRQNDSYGSSNNTSDSYGSSNEPTPGAGKASMGERLKGNAEKLAGRVTGNPSMVERGQVRKSGNPDDTSYNSNESNDY